MVILRSNRDGSAGFGSGAARSTAFLIDSTTAPSPLHSPTFTSVTVPPGTDIDALRQVARERFQVAFAGALGPLSGKAFRIGHLGDQNPASILGCLAGIESALCVQGIPFGRDGVACAVDALRDYIPA